MPHTANTKKVVPFSESRLLRTFILYLFFLVPTSLMPVENGQFWLTLNSGIALLLTAINYILWKKYKNRSVRYFSLHSLVMMVGMAFFSMTPAFKALFPSIYFWVLLGIVFILCLVLFSKYDAIGAAFINPQKKLFKSIIYSYVGVLLLIGVIFWALLVITDTPNWIEVAILFFFIGVFFLMVSPAMLISPERAKELSEGKD